MQSESIDFLILLKMKALEETVKLGYAYMQMKICQIAPLNCFNNLTDTDD